MNSLLNQFKIKLKSGFSLFPILSLIVLLLFKPTILIADNEPNNDCNNQETIAVLNNITNTTSASINGTLCEPGNGVSCTADQNDYYRFTVGSAGTLSVSYATSPNRSTDFYFGKTACGANRVADNLGSYNGSLTLNAGDTVYIRIFRNVNNAWTNYSMQFSFTPATADLSITKIVSNPNPQVGEEITYAIVGRNNGPATSDITITDVLPAGLSWISDTANGKSNFDCTNVGNSVTCTGSEDFITNETVTINIVARVTAAGSITNTATITSANDVPESNSNNNSASVTLTALLPNLSIANTSINEGNSGFNTMNFTVTLSSSTDATINFATSNGTASAGSDYNSTSGNLMFTSGGSTTQTISVPIQGDTVIEANETFTVSLSSPQGATLSNATATGTITNDDFSNFTCANPRAFSVASTYNIKGDSRIIGNTNMCYNNGGVCGDPGNARNNDINMMYSDPDANVTIFNSSSALLDLPSGSIIKSAKLYWQGYLVDENDATKESARSIIFSTPNNPYQTIMSDDYNWVYFTSGRFYYQGSADVKNLVVSGGEGSYTVSNIVSELGQPIGGSYGAWALVIVYENSAETLKNITVFDGYQGIVTSGDQTSATDYANANGCPQTGTGNSMTIPLTGFLTPTKGAVKSSLSIFAGEGDKGATGDHLQLTDKNGTSHYVANTLNPYDDIFNSTITYNGLTVTNATTPVSISPWYSANSNGSDIDTFDVSTDMNGNPLIGNEQTSTNVTLDTNGDGYMPGVFAFSTELYEPRVCYFINTITDDRNITVFQDKQFVQPVESGREYTFDLWISNMKKSATDADIETAKLVQIYLNYYNIDYIENSTQLKNLSQSVYTNLTDINDSDLGEFSSDQNKSTWRVGIDANASAGGTLEPANDFNDNAKKAFVYLKSEFLADGNQSSINLLDFLKFKASFKTDSITISSDQAREIPQCVDFNGTASVFLPELGTYNVVHYNSPITTLDPTDIDDSKNALYTQIVNKDFNVTVLSLDDDNTTLKNTQASVILELVSAESANLGALCSDLPIFFRDDATMGVTFNNSDRVNFSQTILKANKNVYYRIKYINWSGLFNNSDVTCANVSNMSANLKGVPQCLNSDTQIKELFADNGYDISICTDGEKRACDSNMYTSNGVNEAQGPIVPEEYNHNYGCLSCLLGVAAKYTCSRDNFALRPNDFNSSITSNQVFIAENNNSITFRANQYNGIGTKDYNATMTNDPNTTPFVVDINISLDGNKSCAEANIMLDPLIVFLDGNRTGVYRFNNVGDFNLTIHENNGTEYAKVDYDEYGRDTSDINRFITFHTREIHVVPDSFDLNATFLNQSNNGFTYLANFETNSINRDMAAHLDLNISALGSNGGILTNYSSTCYAKDSNLTIDIFDVNASIFTGLQKLLWHDNTHGVDGNISLPFTDEFMIDLNHTQFVGNGTTQIEYLINFDRNATTPVNSFKLTIETIGIDDGNASGLSPDINDTVTFYYGRVHAPDYRGTSPISATIFYEVYAKNINRQSFDINGSESPDSIYWYRNTLHVNGDGNVTTNGFTSVGTTLINDANSSSSGTISGGIETITLKNTPPYVDKIEMMPSPWLTFTPSYFNVEFIATGNWAGEGSVDRNSTDNVGKFTNEHNVTRSNRRLNW
jgi:uncharacterized repeat protein (TIGR01451 family)